MSAGNKVLAIAVSGFVAAAVIAGLYVTGTPAEQRARRQDEARLRDLADIANILHYHWRQYDALPADLGEVTAVVSRDPVTDEPYEYRPKERTYELCAVFSLADADTQNNGRWAHDAGPDCIEINPADTLAIRYYARR